MRELKILRRDAIKEKLQGIFDTPLFLVISDMGYGKSTTLQDYIKHRRRIKYIWFYFPQEQVEDMWLWVRLSKLVERTNSELGKKLLEYGMPYSKYDFDRLEGFIKDAIEVDTVLVLDDVHYCKSEYYLNLIKLLAERKIPKFHIVYISREYPDDSSQLLSKEYTKIINQNDFAFTKNQCSNFFMLNDAPIDANELEILWDHTHGWASGLYMALLYYRTYGTLTNMPDGPQLMRKAVYDNFDPQTKRSLLMLSRLPDFTIEQAEMITDDSHIRQTIENMYTNYCFTKYDDESRSFSFHTLLKQVLDQEFEKSDIDENEILKKEGMWCMASNDPIGAIRAFSLCGDYAHVLSIMAEPHSSKYMSLAPSIIIQAFENMPREVKFSNPLGYLSYIYSYSTTVGVEHGAEMLQEAKDYYSDPYKSPDLVNRNQILGEIAMIESIKAFNDLNAMFRCYERAYEFFDGGSSAIFSSDVTITFGIPLNMFLYHRELGGLKDMVELVEDEFWIYNMVANGSGSGFEFLLHSEYCFKTGDFESAEMLAYKAIYKGRMRDQCDIILSASFVLLRIALFKYKPREVNDIMLQMMQEVEKNGTPVMLSCYEFILGYVFSFLGKYDLVPQWIQGEEGTSKFMAIGRNSAYIIKGKYLSEHGDYEELIELADRMIPEYYAHKTLDGVMIFKVFKAIGLYHTRNLKEGTAELRKAVEMAEKDGICVTIAENTYEIIPMLEQINTPFADKVLKFAKQYTMAKSNFRNRTKHVELTNREKEVMDLVCDGLTAAQIADQLFISHSTVKKHMASAYQKLGVNKKSDAIAEYRRRRAGIRKREIPR
jgi:LuxR family maltose regulon positive regulatory protein